MFALLLLFALNLRAETPLRSFALDKPGFVAEQFDGMLSFSQSRPVVYVWNPSLDCNRAASLKRVFSFSFLEATTVDSPGNVFVRNVPRTSNGDPLPIFVFAHHAEKSGMDGFDSVFSAGKFVGNSYQDFCRRNNFKLGEVPVVVFSCESRMHAPALTTGLNSAIRSAGHENIVIIPWVSKYDGVTTPNHLLTPATSNPHTLAALEQFTLEERHILLQNIAKPAPPCSVSKYYQRVLCRSSTKLANTAARPTSIAAALLQPIVANTAESGGGVGTEVAATAMGDPGPAFTRINDAGEWQRMAQEGKTSLDCGQYIQQKRYEAHRKANRDGTTWVHYYFNVLNWFAPKNL